MISVWNMTEGRRNSSTLPTAEDRWANAILVPQQAQSCSGVAYAQWASTEAGATCALMKSTGEVENARKKERRRVASRARATSAAIRWSICRAHTQYVWYVHVRVALAHVRMLTPVALMSGSAKEILLQSKSASRAPTLVNKDCDPLLTRHWVPECQGRAVSRKQPTAASTVEMSY